MVDVAGATTPVYVEKFSVVAETRHVAWTLAVTVKVVVAVAGAAGLGARTRARHAIAAVPRVDLKVFANVIIERAPCFLNLRSGR